mgnify:CR=1 FL=1
MEVTQTTRSTFGLVGVDRVVAFGLALTHFWAWPFSLKPPLEEVVADKAVKIRDAVVAKLRGEERRSLLILSPSTPIEWLPFQPLWRAF